jgi:hypothetical protein
MRNLLILILLAATTFVACNSDQSTTSQSIEELEEILTSQKWRFDVPLIKEGLNIIKPKMSPGQADIANNALKRVQFGTFEFTEDNKIFLNLNNGASTSQGTWVFTKKEKNLVLTFTSTKAVPHVIRNFTKEQIYLEADPENGLLYPKVFIPLTEGAGLQKDSIQ